MHAAVTNNAMSKLRFVLRLVIHKNAAYLDVVFGHQFCSTQSTQYNV